MFGPYQYMLSAVRCTKLTTVLTNSRLLVVGQDVKSTGEIAALFSVATWLRFLRTLLVYCIAEATYASLLAQIVKNTLELPDTAAVTHSLMDVTFPHPYDSLHVLTNFVYW